MSRAGCRVEDKKKTSKVRFDLQGVEKVVGRKSMV